MITPPTLVLRSVKGSPLAIADGDNNSQAIMDFMNAIAQQVAESLNDNGTLKLYFEDQGTVNNFIVNPAQWVDNPQPDDYPTGYVNGLIYVVKAANANTGDCTLSAASGAGSYLAAIPMRLNGAPLQAGDITQGQLFAVAYDATANVFHVMSSGSSSSSTAPTTTTGGTTTGTGTSGTVNDIGISQFAPADVALPGAGNIAVFPHGFAVMPNDVTVELVCVIGEQGYAAGQCVPLDQFVSPLGGYANQPSFSVQINAVDINVIQNSATPNIVCLSGANKGNLAAITPANWRLRVNAFVVGGPNYYQSNLTALAGPLSAIQFPHGLAVTPNRYLVGLVNQVAEQGYNPGDFVPIEQFMSEYHNPAFSVYVDAANVYVNQSNYGSEAQAGGVLTFTGVPNAGDTVTIGNQTYTFIGNQLFTAAGQVYLGNPPVNQSTVIANLIAAINHGNGAGVTYAAPTPANTSVTASLTVNGIQVWAQPSVGGSLGNAVVTSETSNACSWGATTLTGGMDYIAVTCVSGQFTGTLQSITPANWLLSVFAYAPDTTQANQTIPGEFAVANPDGAMGYNNDLIVFNYGRFSSQTYISNIDLTTNIVTPLQVLPNSNFAVTPQYANPAPIRFDDGVDRIVWSSTKGVWALVLGQYSNAPVPATGTLTFNAQPANNDTVTISGKVYTFQNALTNVDGHVLIGGSINAAIANLAAAISGATGAGTSYAAAMTLNANYTAAVSGSAVIVTANFPGTAGNLIATAASSPVAQAFSWGANTLTGGAGNALSQYGSYDTHRYKPVWVDQTTNANNPDFYLVASHFNGAVANFMTTSVCMWKYHNTGATYPAPAAYGANLNLHNPAIVNGAAFTAFHNINVTNVAKAAAVILFQYNPVKKRIYVMDAETGYLFIFNIKLYAASNNISAWWNQTDTVRYSQLTFEKALVVAGGGSLWANSDREHIAVEYDLTTGQENSICYTRVNNTNLTGSVTRIPWNE